MIIKAFLFFLITLYFVGCTTHHLSKYDNFPCQNKIFKLDRNKVQIVNGKSIIREGYYYITRNSLENHITSTDQYLPKIQPNSIIIKKGYSRGKQFKVVGYYIAYDTTPIPLPGGGRVPMYLVQSIEDKKIFWIPGYLFDIETCAISLDLTSDTFNPYSRNHDANFTKVEINLEKMEKQPFR